MVVKVSTLFGFSNRSLLCLSTAVIHRRDTFCKGTNQQAETPYVKKVL